MKRLDNYRRATQYINKIWNMINTEYFGAELPEVTLTIQENTGEYAHISVSDTWFTVDGKGMREVNLNASTLTRPIENIVTSLIHEACHLYNMEHGIKDTSGYYHNKKFKKTAEEIGHILIEQHDKYGWTISSPSDETLDFCLRNDLEDILIGRSPDFNFGGISGGHSNNTIPTTPKVRKPSSTRRWICPTCGTIIRSTKAVNVICGDCNQQFVESN